MTAAAAASSPYGPPAPRPAFAAFVLGDGRRAGFCWDAKPRCVLGHRIDEDDAPLTEGITRCLYRAHRGAAPCGVRLYLGRVALATGEHAFLVVEVTRSLVRELRARPMLELERLSILRCVLPGVEIDLGAGTPGLTPDEEP